MNVKNSATRNIKIIDAVAAVDNVIVNALKLVTIVPTLPIITPLPNNLIAFFKQINGFTLRIESKIVKINNTAVAIPNAIHKPVAIVVNTPCENSIATPTPNIMLRSIAVPKLHVFCLYINIFSFFL